MNGNGKLNNKYISNDFINQFLGFVHRYSFIYVQLYQVYGFLNLI
jgi:hypothetical protein